MYEGFSSKHFWIRSKSGSFTVSTPLVIRMIHQVCYYCSRQRKFSMVSTNKGCQHSGWQLMPRDAVLWNGGVNSIKPHLCEKNRNWICETPIYSLYSRYTPENICSLEAAKNTAVLIQAELMSVRKLGAEIETAKAFNGKTSDSVFWKCWMWSTRVSFDICL